MKCDGIGRLEHESTMPADRPCNVDLSTSLLILYSYSQQREYGSATVRPGDEQCRSARVAPD
eukprot:scaffold115799_cov48-Prasinocladus_malaysianus.AAC.2